MKYGYIVEKLRHNKEVFASLLAEVSEEEYMWKQSEEKWCLLEIVCHLRDEEVEDFLTRVKYTLLTPHIPPPPINPQAWVKERTYLEQDYNMVLKKFLNERDQSVNWLQSLNNPQWDNNFVHPKHGPRTASMYLANWLAHDYHHIRQINRLQYDYLKNISREDLSYAGNW